MRMSVDRWQRLLVTPWQRGAIAAVAGALPSLAFPEPSLWWFAYVALVPWLLLMRSAPTSHAAAADGWLGGAGFMFAAHHWLLPNLHVFTFVLALLLGVLWAPWGVLVRRLLGGVPSRRRAAAALVLVPSGWVMIELVRSWEYLGGPWDLLGASQWQVTPALRLASLGGVWLVTFLIVALNTALAVLVALPTARTAAVAGGLTVAVAGSAAWAWAPLPDQAGSVRIAVVQPGVLGGGPDGRARFDRQEELTRQLAGQDLDLVVWGESSVSADLAGRPDLRDRLAAVSREVGADLLVNVDARAADRSGIHKSSVLIGPEGPIGPRYDKMRLVPFGEYIPFRSALGWATSVGEAAAEDRRRGTRQVVMAVPGAGDLRIGPLVCFESAFPDMSRHLVQDGAQVLVAQSSTATFQQSWAPEQHASLAALRSAETWRPMVHATLTGVSAVYGPGGTPVGDRLSAEASAAAVYDVPLGGGTSPYVRLGDWVLYGSLAALAAYAAVEGGRSVRRPAPGTAAPPAHTAHGSPRRPRR
ncbi:apolipoprotein N-acyltransferase [Streptomyces pathocidini]|uniref:Apolipoprotein N-acyltransferase n=1 Tax=Streptomyces pathocidini TaxID=1650571 RepID=A0ABW7UYC8_9ACTN|nr:apolipoprotein N-acyltransferase [Streptomyces pathocidini]